MCGDGVYTCEILECLVGKLERGVTENITIIIDIIEKAIASEKVCTLFVYISRNYHKKHT